MVPKKVFTGIACAMTSEGDKDAPQNHRPTTQRRKERDARQREIQQASHN
jgi:hypothetical protein